MSTALTQEIYAVAAYLLDGSQVQFFSDDPVYGRDGAPIPLAELANVLADPSAWVEYDTESTFRETENEPEPWKDESWTPARARLYARGVTLCMTIYESEARL